MSYKIQVRCEIKHKKQKLGKYEAIEIILHFPVDIIYQKLQNVLLTF